MSFTGVVEALKSTSVVLAGSGFFTRGRGRRSGSPAIEEDGEARRVRAEDLQRAAAGEARRAAERAGRSNHVAEVTSSSLYADGQGQILDEPELAIVRPGSLEIWTVMSLPRDRGGGGGGGQTPPREAQSRLVQVAEYPLWGDVQSLAVIPTRGGGACGDRARDAIVLCSRDLHVSVIAYSDEHRELRPTSLHSFRNKPLVQATGLTNFGRAPFARSDPDGRCCAVIMNDSIMATMSIAVDKLGDGGDMAGSQPEAPAEGNGVPAVPASITSPMVSSSYLKSLMSEHGIREVIDMCFLHGYSEPVVLLLHLTQPSWPGNIYRPAYRNSCALAALSLNISRQHHPCIWSRDMLPHDSFKLVPVPGPVGGAVVVSPNILLHVSQTRTVVMAVNSTAEEFVSTSTAAGGMPMTNAPVAAATGGSARDQSTNGDAVAFQMYGCMMPTGDDAFVRCRSFEEDGGGVKIDSGISDLHASWISPMCCAISLETGQLFLLTLHFDGHSVNSMALTERGSVIPPAVICGLGPFRMFIGSMVGDSLLVRYGRRPIVQGSDKKDTSADEQTNKRKRIAGGTPGEADETPAEDDDMAFLYNTSANTGVAQAPGDRTESRLAADVGTNGETKEEIALKVEDSLAGTGVLKDLTYGEITVAGAEDGKADVGLVCCGGEGRFGCLHVLRAAIMPELITEIKLPEILEVWTVLHRNADAIDSSNPEILYHSYLVIGLKSKTMILQTKESLDEIGGKDGVDFITTEPTVAAGSLCDNSFVVQVTPTRVLLLSGHTLLQTVDVKKVTMGLQGRGRSLKNLDSRARWEAAPDSAWKPSAMEVADADICDSMICLTLNNGIILLMQARKSTMELKEVGVLPPSVWSDAKKTEGAGSARPPIQCCRFFADQGGISSWAGRLEETSSLHVAVCDWVGILRLYSYNDSNEHDIPFHSLELVFKSDEPLGTGNPCFFNSKDPIGEKVGNKKTAGVPRVCDMRLVSSDVHHLSQHIVIAFSDSTLRAYKLKQVLKESGGGGGDNVGNGADDLDMLYDNETNGSSTDESVPILYYCQSTSASVGAITSADGEEAINLSLEDDEDDDEDEDEMKDGEKEGDNDDDDDDDEGGIESRIYPFNNIGGSPGITGMFISGSHPRWYVFSRGKLLQHSSLPVGAVTSFAAFHNVNSPHGFVIVTKAQKESSLRLCQLPANVDMAGGWPVQRVPLSATPISIAWHSEARVYALSVVVQGRAQKRLEEEAPTHPEAIAAAQWTQDIVKDSLADGMEDQCEIQLLAPGTWQRLYRLPLEPSETCTFLKIVRPMNTVTKVRESFVAVGTCTCLGEDYPVHGRLLLLELQPGPTVAGAVQTCKVTVKYEREHRSSVTAIAPLDDFIVISTSDRTVGTKLMVQSWDGSQLMSIAFFDASMYVLSLSVIKNFIMLLDVRKGCQFVQWKPKERLLTMLGKDFSPADVNMTEFLIDEPYMSLVGSDAMGNLQTLSYAPGNVESWKGQKLLCSGHVHTGRSGIRGIRLKIPVPSAGSSRPSRHAVLISTIEGSLQLVLPLEEMTFRRLVALQDRLSHVVPSCAGLNPKAHTRPVITGGCPVRAPPGANLLNMEVLARYTALNLDQQNSVAEHIGSTRGQIIANLAVVNACLSHL